MFYFKYSDMWWLFLLTFSVHESIFVLQGHKSHPVLVNERRIYRFHKQGKAIFVVLSRCFAFCAYIKSLKECVRFSCPDAMHFFILTRKEKIDSEHELNITPVYGAVW